MEPREETKNTETGSPFLKLFIEPSAGFRLLLDRPRFFGVTVFIAILTIALSASIIETVGFENMIEQRVNESRQFADMPPDKRQELVAMQSGPLMKVLAIGSGGIASVAIIFLGGLYYWFSMTALGSKVRFPHGVAVWAYSSVPPLILVTIANLVVLALKPVEDMDLALDSAGVLVKANPTIFLAADSSPAVLALVSSLDFFSLMGWVLAVIGIKTVGKLSGATALGIVGLMALFGIAARVVIAAFVG